MQCLLRTSFWFHCFLQYGDRINPLVNVQGDRINGNLCTFLLAGPLQLRIQSRIITVFFARLIGIRLRGYQPYGRIIRPLSIFVYVLANPLVFCLTFQDICEFLALLYFCFQHS